MAKYSGKLLKVEWLPTGGTAGTDEIDLSGSSRQFDVDETGNEVDVTTRDSTGKETLTDTALTERTAKLNGLDTTGAPDWDDTDLDIGDTGTLIWYPEGESTGKRKRSATAIVTARKFGSPHDNAATWEISFKLNTAITRATVS